MPEQTARVDGFLEEWHRVVATRDLAGLGDLLAEDIAMGAPPYWEKLSGHALVLHLLGLILATIEGFSYRREWRDGDELALEFTGRVGDLDVQGIDLISLDAAGRVRNLDVLMRPINTLLALRDVIAPQMTEYLTRSAGKR